ncbi:MAG: alpha/beta hydrolase [Bacteroidota bacterium]
MMIQHATGMIRKASTALLLLLVIHSPGSGQESSEADRPLKPPKGYRSETMLKAAYALGFLDLIDREPPVPSNIRAWKDIVYKEVDTITLKLDIYRKTELKDPAPILIFIHGGSWSGGERSDYLPYLIDYAEKGYVTVTVSYRLSGVAQYPAAVEDVKCAVKWIRSHAEAYSIDPERIALVGGSAGGHLAMMVAYADEKVFGGACNNGTGEKVKAIVNLYGPADLTSEDARNHSKVRQFLGKGYQDAPELYRISSPRTHISRDDPPTLIFHGTLDSTVPVGQSDSLHRWLNIAGVPNEYHRLKGWPHTMDLSQKVNAYCQYYMDAFFKEHL